MALKEPMLNDVLEEIRATGERVEEPLHIRMMLKVNLVLPHQEARES
jgi:hypothetical protein